MRDPAEQGGEVMLRRRPSKWECVRGNTICVPETGAGVIDPVPNCRPEQRPPTAGDTVRTGDFPFTVPHARVLAFPLGHSTKARGGADIALLPNLSKPTCYEISTIHNITRWPGLLKHSWALATGQLDGLRKKKKTQHLNITLLIP